MFHVIDFIKYYTNCLHHLDINVERLYRTGINCYSTQQFVINLMIELSNLAQLHHILIEFITSLLFSKFSKA